MPKANARSREAERPQIKKISITKKIFSGISLILILCIAIPIIVYEYLPDGFYLLIPGVRMWFAADELLSDFAGDSFTATLDSVEKRYDATVELYNSSGQLVYSTYFRTEMEENLHFPLDEATVIDDKYKTKYEKANSQDFLIGDRGYDIGLYNTAGIEVEFLIHYCLIDTGERINMVLQTSQLSATTRIQLILMSVTMMLLMLLALIIIAVFLGRTAKPIKSMARITDKMSKLDFSEKCPPVRVLELSELSERINNMSVSLDTALTELQSKNAKLQKDIEDERTLDNLRQVFISGVSHELKTPIAIIQGYAEGAKTFLGSDPAAAAEYCTVIMDEAVRMNQMVMKLLEITKYDSGAYVPSQEAFSLHSMFAAWFTKEENIFAEKGIRACNEIPENWYGEGDSFVLASVANNYLSNAVSHVAGEDKCIRAYGEDRGEVFRISVFNTGLPIADKDIDKIWASFYRADKAMSRAQGRFGLGLAIVASIQKIHGREYGVENKPDGVRFWFDVKKAEIPQE